ncbi:unknown protein [Desulfotalea psychrophila LSv54]|uniref:Uncharacterized protein n=1 Tax=Desulfotalea psychrophila (strain LSv54 / DSM 12343) TaxID=177439 RepID=Q6AM02_DESPS|nr:unknown protein [Desulfotalea psychrophila LSv54]
MNSLKFLHITQLNRILCDLGNLSFMRFSFFVKSFRIPVIPHYNKPIDE